MVICWKFPNRQFLEIIQSRFHLAGRDKRHIRSFIREVRYERRTILDEIAGILDLDFQAFLKVRKPYMSKAQVHELAEQSFFIGAHGMDHAEFSLLNLDGQLEQFYKSLEFVQKEFRQDHGLFAFPFNDDGVSTEFFDKIMQSGKMMTTFGTAGLKKDPVPFHHQRISMENLRLPCLDL